YCSMAFGNQGAAWLQSHENVRNPYFGEVMLECANEISLFWEPAADTSTASPPSEVPEAFLGQIGRPWEAYLEMQEALALDDPEQSARAAGSLGNALEAIDGSSLAGQAGPIWERERANLSEAISRIADAQDLERQRAGFALLSETMPAVL